MAFITLVKRGISGCRNGEVTVNPDTITRMERDEFNPLTDVYLSDGTVFTVSESPTVLLRMIRDAKEAERDGN